MDLIFWHFFSTLKRNIPKTALENNHNQFSKKIQINSLSRFNAFFQFHRYPELEFNKINAGKILHLAVTVDSEKKVNFHSIHQEHYLKVQVAFASPTNSKVICADTLCSKTAGAIITYFFPFIRSLWQHFCSCISFEFIISATDCLKC